MSGFLDGDVDFNVKFNELIDTLDTKRKYSSHWKWLHDQLFFWEKKLNQSELFEESEIQTILVLLVPYLCQIFRHHKVQNRKEFIRLIEKDIQLRYERSEDWDWNCLLDEPSEEEIGEEEFINETSSSDDELDLESTEEKDSNIEATLSLGMTNSEESKKFHIKVHFLLDLLIPNNFQYFVYKAAFGSNRIFKNREYILRYPLYFPAKYYISVVETRQKVSAKVRITRTFKKEDDLKVQAGETIYVVKPDDKIIVYKSIIPLRMANEANEDFWEDLEASKKLPLGAKKTKQGKEEN